MTARYVILGLASPRSNWFNRVAQWSTSGAIPIEFIKCVSAEELTARLETSRRYSAVLIDAELSTLNVDFIRLAKSQKVKVIAIQQSKIIRDINGLTINAELNEDFDIETLVVTIAQHCVPVSDRTSPLKHPTNSWSVSTKSELVAVTGTGGTGTSTVASAIAQALAYQPGADGTIVLLDAKLRAEQAMLHDTGDVIPGLQEIIERCQNVNFGPEELRSFTQIIPPRKYHVIQGIRQPQAWTTIGPGAFDVALKAARSGFEVVVADCESDLENERDSGSHDIHEKNAMARLLLTQSTMIFVVVHSSSKGIYSLGQLLRHFLNHDIDLERCIPVFNNTPKKPGQRSQLQSAWNAIRDDLHLPTNNLIFVPHFDADMHTRDVSPFPENVTTPLICAYRTAHRKPTVDVTEEAQRIIPGELGQFSDDENEAIA